VDAPGRIVSRAVEENAVAFIIEPDDPAILKYIIPRGSITLDGISLTVVRVVEGTFTVSITPHTLAQTILIDKHAGASINIECDLLGKYVERLLQFQGSAEGTSSKKTGITQAYLIENGFN
jgi:riboflavin synthase